MKFFFSRDKFTFFNIFSVSHKSVFHLFWFPIYNFIYLYTAFVCFTLVWISKNNFLCNVKSVHIYIFPPVKKCPFRSFFKSLSTLKLVQVSCTLRVIYFLVILYHTCSYIPVFPSIQMKLLYLR